MEKLKFKTLSAFMPVGAMKLQAWEETRNLTERHDIPNNESVPEDLRDKAGRFFRTREGYRIAGRLLVHDMLEGSPSSAISLVFAIYPLLAIFVGLGQSLGLFGAAMTALVNFSWIAMVITISGGGLFKILGLLIITSMATGASWMAPVFGAIPVVGQQIAMMVSSSATGGWISFIGCLIPAFLPLFPAISHSRSRARALAAQGSLCNLESLGEFSNAFNEARRQQAENAAKDETPFLNLGKATGHCTGKWDAFAPDEGLTVGLTSNDLSVHLVVFGKTGSGKTSRALSPLAFAYAEHDKGGMLVLDGKGSLPGDFSRARLPNFRLVDPANEVVSLTEGLDPVTLTAAVVALGSTGDKESAFFTNSGQTLLFCACTLLKGVIELEKSQGVNPPNYRWTLSSIYGFYNDLATNTGFAQEIVDWVRKNSVDKGALADACNYWSPSGEFHGSDKDTSSNIKATVNAWISPIFTHEELRSWADAETGLRVEDVLEGARMGFNVPIFKYDKAGLLVSSLVKGRVFKGVRMRGDGGGNWQERLPEHRPLLLIVDEAQDIVGSYEIDMLPVGRSLGLRCVYASQSVDNFVSKLGETKALALLDNFVSFMTFQASPNTLKWVVSQIGFSQQLKFTTGGMGIDYQFTANLASTSPLRDPAHPDRKVFRNLVRDMKAGGVKTVADMVFPKAKGVAGFFGGGNATDRNNVFTSATEINPVTRGEFKVGPVLDQDNLSAVLSTPGMAFIQVQRGGVKRRDVCKTHFVQEWKNLEIDSST